jgi:hypothetical protein
MRRCPHKTLVTRDSLMSKFTLQPDRWYGWQMIPGYVGERCVPYCCPIRVHKVEPLKSGKGIMKVDFWNTGYAAGVQGFSLDLQLLHRAKDYLVARILYGDSSTTDRCAVVSHIEFQWIQQFCPHLWHNHPPHLHGSTSSVSIYLDAVFGVQS